MRGAGMKWEQDEFERALEGQGLLSEAIPEIARQLAEHFNEHAASSDDVVSKGLEKIDIGTASAQAAVSHADLDDAVRDLVLRWRQEGGDAFWGTLSYAEGLMLFMPGWIRDLRRSGNW